MQTRVSTSIATRFIRDLLANKRQEIGWSGYLTTDEIDEIDEVFARFFFTGDVVGVCYPLRSFEPMWSYGFDDVVHGTNEIYSIVCIESDPGTWWHSLRNGIDESACFVGTEQECVTYIDENKI